MADGLAERDVDIHRDGLPRLAQGAVVQPPGLLLGIERFGKVIGRGIGGIPRSRLVEDANLLKCRHGIHVKSMTECVAVVLILINAHI